MAQQIEEIRPGVVRIREGDTTTVLTGESAEQYKKTNPLIFQTPSKVTTTPSGGLRITTGDTTTVLTGESAEQYKAGLVEVHTPKTLQQSIKPGEGVYLELTREGTLKPNVYVRREDSFIKTGYTTPPGYVEELKKASLKPTIQTVVQPKSVPSIREKQILDKDLLVKESFLRDVTLTKTFFSPLDLSPNLFKMRLMGESVGFKTSDRLVFNPTSIITGRERFISKVSLEERRLSGLIDKPIDLGVGFLGSKVDTGLGFLAKPLKSELAFSTKPGYQVLGDVGKGITKFPLGLVVGGLDIVSKVGVTGVGSLHESEMVTRELLVTTPRGTPEAMKSFVKDNLLDFSSVEAGTRSVLTAGLIGYTGFKYAPKVKSGVTKTTHKFMDMKIWRDTAGKVGGRPAKVRAGRISKAEMGKVPSVKRSELPPLKVTKWGRGEVSGLKIPVEMGRVLKKSKPSRPKVAIEKGVYEGLRKGYLPVPAKGGLKTGRLPTKADARRLAKAFSEYARKHQPGFKPVSTDTFKVFYNKARLRRTGSVDVGRGAVAVQVSKPPSLKPVVGKKTPSNTLKSVEPRVQGRSLSQALDYRLTLKKPLKQTILLEDFYTPKTPSQVRGGFRPGMRERLYSKIYSQRESLSFKRVFDRLPGLNVDLKGGVGVSNLLTHPPISKSPVLKSFLRETSFLGVGKLVIPELDTRLVSKVDVETLPKTATTLQITQDSKVSQVLEGYLKVDLRSVSVSKSYKGTFLKGGLTIAKPTHPPVPIKPLTPTTPRAPRVPRTPTRTFIKHPRLIPPPVFVVKGLRVGVSDFLLKPSRVKTSVFKSSPVSDLLSLTRAEATTFRKARTPKRGVYKREEERLMAGLTMFFPSVEERMFKRGKGLFGGNILKL